MAMSYYPMRKSRVLKKIREGGVVSCFKTNLIDPRVIEMFAMAGLDCVWLCAEHVPIDYLVLENMIRAAKIYDMDAIVRARRGSYSDHIVGFEMDAAGVMVPHVMGLEDAKEVVRMTKFPPLGRRAVDGGNADGRFCRVPPAEYVKTANEERFVICQIEDPEAVPDIEAMAELPGVDMLLFGPGDFSVAIGKPGQPNAPEVREVLVRVAKAARAAGKAAMAVGSPETLKELVDMGYNVINLGADVVPLAEYADSLAHAMATLGT